MRTPYAFDLRCQGASHTKRNKDCQDYSCHVQNERYAVAIVCDGHGGSDYVRSAEGSKLAAEAAMKYIPDFVEKVDSSRLKDPSGRDELLTKLKKRIIRCWRDTVREYHANHPFTQEEEAALSGKARKRYFQEGRVEVAYGTTLLAAVCTETYWFGLHIGDGRCVYVDADSKFHEIPLDERCFLNATTSICDTDAPAHFHHLFSGQLPAAVFVACDGVDGSFDSPEKLYNFYKTILYSFASEQPQDAEDGLRDFLPRLSANGSGDDISIAAVLDLDAIKNLDMIRAYDPGRAKAQKEENQRKEAQRNERERRYLTKTATLKNEIRELRQRLAAKEREFSSVGDDLSDQRRQIENLKLNLSQQEQEKRQLEEEREKIKLRIGAIDIFAKQAPKKRKEFESKLNDLQAARSTVKRECESLQREIEEKERNLKQVEERRQIELQESTLQERAEEVQRKEKEISQQEEALNRKKQDLSREEAEVTDKANSLAQKKEELALQSGTVADNVPQPVMGDTPQAQPVTSDAPQAQPVTGDTPQAQPVTGDTPQAQPVTSDAPQAQPVTDDTPQAQPVTSDAPQPQPQPEYTTMSYMRLSARWPQSPYPMPAGYYPQYMGYSVQQSMLTTGYSTPQPTPTVSDDDLEKLCKNMDQLNPDDLEKLCKNMDQLNPDDLSRLEQTLKKTLENTIQLYKDQQQPYVQNQDVQQWAQHLKKAQTLLQNPQSQ